MLSGINSLRRRFRSFYQRVLLVSILIGISVLTFSYLNLEFCYKIFSQSTLNHMCIKFRNRQYTGSLCEELCNGDVFKDFKCPNNELKTTIFTAQKSNDVYAVKMAKNIKDDLTWADNQGVLRYPKLKDFESIVKTHITVTYNVTLEEGVLQSLVSQEIDANTPEQMINFWRLFKDNNYMMGKLYDDDGIFPTILGSCGPYYATENLNPLQPETGFKHYITIDWEGRLKFAMIILDFLYRLEMVKPEPLKICKIETKFFGMATDKRVKYQTAQFIRSETQMDKLLSDGAHCTKDDDCIFESCIGKCDPELKICNGIQQNSNLQIACQHIFKGARLFPGLLSTAKTPASLVSILNTCSDPTKNNRNHFPGRLRAPTQDIGIRLYNELKRIYNEVTFVQ